MISRKKENSSTVLKMTFPQLVLSIEQYPLHSLELKTVSFNQSLNFKYLTNIKYLTLFALSDIVTHRTNQIALWNLRIS